MMGPEGECDLFLSRTKMQAKIYCTGKYVKGGGTLKEKTVGSLQRVIY